MCAVLYQAEPEALHSLRSVWRTCRNSQGSAEELQKKKVCEIFANPRK